MPYAMVLYRASERNLVFVVDPGPPNLVCAQEATATERAQMDNYLHGRAAWVIINYTGGWTT